MYYSQCLEDKFLNDNYFKNKQNGTYIELGALDGIRFSNTKFFEDTLNWKGILIEPHPLMFKSLSINRPNNFLFNELISDSKEELEFKYFEGLTYAAVSGVENSLSQHHYDTYFNNERTKTETQKTVIIKPKTLAEIILNTNLKHIDFLSLDVEGHEFEVLNSYDFSVPIDIILIEMLGVQKDKDEKCRNLLISKNYVFLSKCAHNEIWVLNEKNI
jgi:FkbM family methyltransferase